MELRAGVDSPPSDNRDLCGECVCADNDQRLDRILERLDELGW